MRLEASTVREVRASAACADTLSDVGDGIWGDVDTPGGPGGADCAGEELAALLRTWAALTWDGICAAGIENKTTTKHMMSTAYTRKDALL